MTLGAGIAKAVLELSRDAAPGVVDVAPGADHMLRRARDCSAGRGIVVLGAGDVLRRAWVCDAGRDE